MGRYRSLLAALLVTTFVQIGTNSVAGAEGEAIIPQDHCGDGFFEVSGSVTSGGQAYNTWVEYRFETDAMPATTAAWLGDAGDVRVQTTEGAYSLCIPNSIEFDGADEVVTRVQVFAYPDLTTWDGASEPTVAYTGGTILQAEDCAAGCTTNIAIQTPTVWGQSEADLYFIFQGPNYVTNFPAYAPTGATTVANQGKLSAAFPFSVGSTYDVQGNVDSSGSALDTDFGFEFAFSQTVVVDENGSAGEISAPNFYAELTYPAGFDAPRVNEDGSWSGEPTVYLLNATQLCSDTFYQDPSCPVPFDRRHPSRLSANLTLNTPYIVASQFDILPLQYGIIMLTAGDPGSLLYWSDAAAQQRGESPATRALPTRTSAFQLALKEPNFFLEAINGGQQQKTSAYAMRWDAGGCGDRGCFNFAQDARVSSGSSNLMGWSPTDGLYALVFEADINHDFTGPGPHFADTRHYVQVDGGEIIATCSYTPGGAAPVCEGQVSHDLERNTYSFSVDEANLIINVTDLNGNALPRNGVEIAPLDSPWTGNWRQYVNTSSTGYAGLNLSEGNWKIIARAPEGDLTQSDSIVNVTIGAEDTAVTPLRQRIALSEPNVRGFVLRPDGAVSRFAYVDVAKKMAGGGDDWIDSASTGTTGNFAISLPTGNYKIAVRPPSGDSSVASTYYVRVDDDLVPCIVSSYTDLTCDEDTPDGPFSFVLASPNFFGRLSLPSGVGIPGFVSYGIWNEGLGWFVYEGQSAEASSNGVFGLALGVDATYELQIQPREGTDAAETQVYLHFSASGSWCFTSLNEVRQPVNCDANQSGEALIALQSGNFAGSVSGPSGPVAEGWVEATIDTDFGPQVLRRSGVRRDGTFSLYLKIETESWQQVKVTVNPPWNDATLVAVSRNYWVKGTEICADQSLPSSSCDRAVTSDLVESFSLSTGNVTGVVTKPDQSPAGGVHISVQKKGPEGWWDWVHDKWARTDSSGLYSLGLDDGEYQLTARPFEISGASATTVSIQVADGVVTLVNGVASSVVNVQLAAPNVTATILAADGNTPIARAWVAVQRKTAQGWWEWMGALGGESKLDGAVEISVPVDATSQTYRLLVHRPWGSTADLSNFYSSEFTLSSGGQTGASFGGQQSLKFPSPNIKLELRQSSAQGAQVVPNAWVYLEKRVGPNQYQWIDIGSSTSFEGKVSLHLPCLENTSCDAADYRVVVDPPWGSANGLPRFTVDLGDLLTNGASNSISYPSPNVFGRVMIDSAANRANRNGWTEVFAWDNSSKQITGWLGGTPVSRDGLFSLNLAGGSHYLLRMNPNGSTEAAPVEVVVKIKNDDSFESCEYRTGGACSASSFNVDVDFASIPKNTRIQVESGNVPIATKAFVTLSSVTLGISMSVVTNDSGLIDLTVPVDPATDWQVSAVAVDGASVLSGSEANQTLGQGIATAITVEVVVSP